MSKPIIQLNEETVKSELKEMVRNSVEETLNSLLNKEAEELTSAAGVPFGALQPQADNHIRRGNAEYPEAERCPV